MLPFVSTYEILIERREITHEKIEKVMRTVDRGDFAKRNFYEDFPQYIGYGATISAPHMVLL